MSNPKYTPMQILRDNLRIKIQQTKNTNSQYWEGQNMAYKHILEMIEGDSLGKPLLEQEIDCLEQAYQLGINTPDLINEAESYCSERFTLVPILKEI